MIPLAVAGSKQVPCVTGNCHTPAKPHMMITEHGGSGLVRNVVLCACTLCSWLLCALHAVYALVSASVHCTGAPLLQER
jgi:hypothetical protein